MSILGAINLDLKRANTVLKLVLTVQNLFRSHRHGVDPFKTVPHMYDSNQGGMLPKLTEEKYRD